jgi:phosphoribosylcarboxyaminoimidazole (NCAIR) mutase
MGKAIVIMGSKGDLEWSRRIVRALDKIWN